MRNSGINIVGKVPWGAHFCLFHQNLDDLLVTLVPFFRQGLNDNEYCIWVLADQLTEDAARQALLRETPEVEQFLDKGCIEFHARDAVFAFNGKMNADLLVKDWEKATYNARQRGFDGLRLGGAGVWRDNNQWQALARYEALLQTEIGKHPIIACCCFEIGFCGANEIMELMSTHDFAISRRNGQYEWLARQRSPSSGIYKRPRPLPDTSPSDPRRAADLAVTELQKEVLDPIRADRALRDSIRMLEAFFRHNLTPFVILDSRFNFVRVNDAYARSCNRRPEEFIGKNHFDLYPHAENQAIFENVVRAKAPFQAFAKPFVFPDHPEWGVTYWNWRLVPLLDDAGEVELLFFSLEDVTEQHTAGEKVKSGFHYARGLIEASLDPFIAINPQGRIVDVNRAAELAAGATRERLIGGDFDAHFTEPQKAREGRLQVLRDGFVRDYPLTIVRGDGVNVDVLFNATVYKNEAGEVQGVFAAARDITDRRERERRDAFMRLLLEHFAQHTNRKDYLDEVVKVLQEWSGRRCIGIRIRDDRGGAPYESYTGFSREFWALENWLMLDRDHCACVRVINQALEPQDLPMITPMGSFRCENTLAFVNQLSPAERQRYRGNCIKHGFASIAIIPIRYREHTLGAIHIADERPNASPLPMVEFIETMSPLIGEAVHRFNIEDELRRNCQALEQRTEQLRALAAELAHAEQRERRRLSQVLHDHLQQMLVGAKYNLELVRARLKGGEMRRMVDQVNEVLDQSIRESRSLTVELYPPVLQESGFLAALQWLTLTMKDKHGLIVRLDAPDRRLGLPDDVRIMLFHAVRELLFNIVKHAQSRNAEITILPPTGNQDQMEVIVADNGVGFDASRIESKGAEGFGLFSIQERLRGIGGAMTVESSPGHGARVRLLVPLTRGQRSALQDSPP